jgi:hypothetical protein
MSRLNIFIDGSWLFKVCQPDGVLSKKTENDTYPFPLDFTKLNHELLDFVCSLNATCTEIGDCYFATSIFALPSDFSDWPNRYADITTANIETTKRNVSQRESFARSALSAGYKTDALYRPNFKKYMLDNLRNHQFQEKMVDASVVALLVKYAIVNPDDFHVVITGDSDILPAIKVAYPEYSDNVIIATVHPDELRAEHRQTSFSFTQFNFTYGPYYFQEHTKELIQGDFIYSCNNCGKIIVKQTELNRGSMPYCSNCR